MTLNVMICSSTSKVQMEESHVTCFIRWDSNHASLSHFGDKWNIIRRIERVIHFSSKLGINSRALALGRKGVDEKLLERQRCWCVLCLCV